MHILIIGVGSIGERHLRNFLRLDGVRCSIAEPNAALRGKMEENYRLESACANWEETNLSDFDGAVICAPTNLHVPIMTRLVEAGVNVLSEKPLAMEPAGIAELKRKIREKSVTAGVAFCIRHDPLIGEIKERIEQGDLGAVRAVNYYASQHWPSMRKGWPPAYAQKRETGGGVIPDHLIHAINYLEWLLGPVAAVSAYQRHIVLDGIPTEDYGTVTLRFSAGPVAQLTLCLFQHDAHELLQIVGDEGTIRLERDTERLQVFHKQSRVWQSGRVSGVNRDDLFMMQAEHFTNCIEGKAEPRCTVEEAEKTLRVILAAMESSDADSRFVCL